MSDVRESTWMDEQAAEYADLVGSFVESVHDDDTDEMVEYQLIWEGGDLGVALTPIENEPFGVMVSRVTGKGFPFGIKNVGPGDVLLSINLRDTTKLTLDQVVAYLQECDLPATLRFKKVSPDLDRVSAPPAVPRVSHFLVTSDLPTSPKGSRPSNASSRASQKSVISANSYAAQNGQRNARGLSTASSRQSMQQQQGRASVASQPRPSDLSSSLPSPPPTTQPPAAPRQTSLPAPAPVPVAPPAPKQMSPPKPAKKAAAPMPTPAPVPAPAPVPVPAPVAAPAAAPPSPKAKPVPAPVVVAAAAAAKPKTPAPASPSPVAKAAPVAAPVVVAAAVAAVAAPELPELGRLSLASDASSVDRASWKSSEEDIDAARERMDELKDLEPVPVPSLARGESIEGEQQQRGKAQSIAMLGDYSIQTNGGIPILPEQSMGMIASIDGVPQVQDFADSDEDESPVGHAVQPARSSHVPGIPPSIDDKPDIPRESVRLTMDGGAEPMMKSQPIGALHELCAKGNLRSVMQHIKVNGADGLIQREPNHGQTCLQLAVKSGSVQLVKHILEQYQPIDELINIEDDKGNTALHFAATKTPGMVHLLLDNGASANVKNSRKLTPLIISVITSRDDNIIVPRMLLKYGANPNDMHDSQTVIHTAVGSGMLHIAGALVHAGAKMDVEDADGKSVYEKLDKKSIRFLISHIYFPPTYITEKERTDCMLCHKKIKFGHRKNNCTHCGRLCCTECSSLMVEMHKFPMGFPGRVHKGAAVRQLKKVCKTCFGVFKERGDTPQKEESRFLHRVIGIEWDEVNPNKLQTQRDAGRRGNKDY